MTAKKIENVTSIRPGNAFLGSNDAQRHAHDPTRIAMFSDAARGVETRAQQRNRECEAHAGEAIPGLLSDIVVTHILRSEYFDDPADLARLQVVSCATRDAVAATGLAVEELNATDAMFDGRLSVLKRMQRQGLLHVPEGYLCNAAARSGQLEELKKLRKNS